MVIRFSIGFIAAFLLLCSTTSTFAGGWMFYIDGPYKGKVVDLETGAPVEGAVVAGVWHVDQYGGPGGVIATFCDAKEALTDKNGEFKVPRASCWHWWPFSKLGIPSFTVFKPGYLGYPPLGATQEERKARMPEFTGQEFRDKNQYYIIKLGRPKTTEEREKTLSSAEEPLVLDLEDFDLMKKKTPHLLTKTTQERKELGLPSRR